MNLTTAAALLPSLENMFGQVYGWTLPTTVVIPKAIDFCEYSLVTNIISLGAFKCTPAIFSFVWFHEAFHHVQFTLENRSSEKYWETVESLVHEHGDIYIWIKEEREANLAAYEMCKRLGLIDFSPWWIPAGYFD